MKKTLKFLLVLFFLIIIISLASPFYLKYHFNQHAENYLGRKAHLRSLSFNPFTCSIQAKDLIIREKDDSATFAGFRSFQVNLHFSKLFLGQFQVEEVTLDSPYVNIINEAGLFNFNDLLPEEDSSMVEENTNDHQFEFEILNLKVTIE